MGSTDQKVGGSNPSERASKVAGQGLFLTNGAAGRPAGGPRGVHTPLQQVLESVRNLGISLREQMSIRVVGDRDRGVPHPLHNGVWVCGGGDAEGGVRMPQVVEAEALGEACRTDGGLELSLVEVGVA